MKKLNILLAIVLAILLALTAYFFIGGSLKATAYPATAPAAEHPDVFESIRNILASRSAPQQFSQLPETPDGCTLIDATITLRNRGLFAAEWIDVSVIPVSGDIAVYSLSGEGTDIPAGSSTQINLKLITASPGVPHTVQLQYYVFGMSRTVTVTI